MPQFSAFGEVNYVPFPAQRSTTSLPFPIPLIALTLLKWVSICPAQQLHINKANYADCLLI